MAESHEIISIEIRTTQDVREEEAKKVLKKNAMRDECPNPHPLEQ